MPEIEPIERYVLCDEFNIALTMRSLKFIALIQSETNLN